MALRRQLSFYLDLSLKNRWRAGTDQHRCSYYPVAVISHYCRMDDDNSVRLVALCRLGCCTGSRCPPCYMAQCPALTIMVAVYKVSPKSVSMMTDKTEPTLQSISFSLTNLAAPV